MVNRSPARHLLALVALCSLTAVPVATSAQAAAPSRASAATSSGKVYTFSGARLGGQWGIYNSTYGGDANARVPALVTVSGNQLHVATRGIAGSGLCLCMQGGSPRKPYGRWIVRARASANNDHGFAIQLWPNAEDWPAGGEIDLAEYPTGARNLVDFTVHYGAANNQIHRQFRGSFSDWHNYSVRWAPHFIAYRIDGRLLATIRNQAAIPTRPMHLAFLAGPEQTGAASPTQAVLDVAWVKYFP